MDRSDGRDPGDIEDTWATVILPHGFAGNRTCNEMVRFGVREPACGHRAAERACPFSWRSRIPDTVWEKETTAAPA